MSPRARKAGILAAPLLWMALLFAASSIPGRGGTWLTGFDKVAHVAAYAVLGFLARRALREAGLGPASSTLLAFVAGAAYGVTDEYHQSFVPGRSVEVADAIADAIGSAIGAAVAAARERRRAQDGGAPAVNGR